MSPRRNLAVPTPGATCSCSSSRSSALTTLERLSRSRRYQPPQRPHPRPERRVGISQLVGEHNLRQIGPWGWGGVLDSLTGNALFEGFETLDVASFFAWPEDDRACRRIDAVESRQARNRPKGNPCDGPTPQAVFSLYRHNRILWSQQKIDELLSVCGSR